MKNILIDLYKTKDLNSGLGQFSKNFGVEIAAQQPQGFNIHFLMPPNNELLFETENVHVKTAKTINNILPNKGYDIWHSLHQFPAAKPSKKTTWILTIHDLNFLIEKSDKKKKKYLKRLQKNINRADCITTISHFTKSEIEKHLKVGKKEIHVIYNGVESGQNIKKTKPDFIGDDNFFFSIGIFNKKKNFEVLIPLMKHFKNHKLIIAGNNDTNYGTELKELIKKHGIEDQIILPGKITESNKQWLYAHCEAFLFPSLAEGFGLPVIEAMYEGKPVFLSTHTSLPEIGGDAAFYFSNFDVDEMAQLIKTNLEKVKSDKAAFEANIKKHANQFNWKNCIAEYLKLYKSYM